MNDISPREVPIQVLLDRDLSQLEFNRRVLHEACDPRTPLLERVKFLAIFGSNVDEFFMKRVARLKGQLAHGALEASGNASARSANLIRIRETILAMLTTQADAYTRVIRPELAREGIDLLEWSELSDRQRQSAQDYFRRSVFPVLTPLAVDPGHPFPFLSNLSTSLGITLRTPGTDDRLFARVKVPDAFPQWVPLPDDPEESHTGRRTAFVRLADVIRHHLEELFPGMEVLEAMPFRITRNIDVEMEEDPENLVDVVQAGLRMRRLEKAVRLEYGHPVSSSQLTMLLRKLDLSETDAYEMPAELSFTGMMALASLNRPELRDPPWTPVVPAAFADEDSDVFSVIRQGDVLVHHPYESFDATTARFIRAAAEDPRVLGLKMTMYRVGSDTPFVDALVRAAEAGKQVACLVELTARMDERQNIEFAQLLEKVGVHVVYGVLGLKTHCKTTLVVRQDEDAIRCYAHVGTGNYHVKTAKLYTDVGLFTCDPVLTADVANLFHYLTGRSRKRDYAKVLVAPINMRERFLKMIDGEIANARAGRPARIVAKMNQLEDDEMVRALIRASQAGVPTDLIVRGICILAPGVPGWTDNIRVTSLVGRFLEHSRIYFFQNGSADPVGGSFFIGSADWMTRNLSERVEAIAPVEAPALRERLWELLQIALDDQRLAWDLDASGAYRQRRPDVDATGGPRALGTQRACMDLARQRALL